MKIEIKGVDNVLSMTDPKKIDIAAVRSLNHTIGVARTAGLKDTREDWNIKAAPLKKYTKIKRATKGSMTAVFTIESHPIPLIEFAARQTKRGTTYKVKRRTGRQRINSAFITTTKSGHRGVFRRKTKRRLPIVELNIITPTSMFEQESDDVFAKTIKSKFPERFWHELNRLMKK